MGERAAPFPLTRRKVGPEQREPYPRKQLPLPTTKKTILRDSRTDQRKGADTLHYRLPMKIKQIFNSQTVE